MSLAVPTMEGNGLFAARRIPTEWMSKRPDDIITGPDAVLAAALDYVAAGLSVIPIAADGSKSPDHERLPRFLDEEEGRYRCSWRRYQVYLPSADELHRWRALGGYYGLACVAGAVSGGQPGLGLEVIDCDNWDVAEAFVEVVRRRSPQLLDRLTQVRSPRPGLHLYYRCSTFGSSQKLACCPVEDEATGKPKRKTLIESKGEGGYVVIPPSPPHCHPRHERYVFVDGRPDLLHVPTISCEERAVLIDAARSLNSWNEVAIERGTVKTRGTCTPHGGTRPGDVFNQQASWSEILVPHGWCLASQSGGVEYWRRPGKTNGHSASINFVEDCLHVFTSNGAPFDDGGTYGKFAAYTILNHDGDYAAAARAVRGLGYGSARMADHGDHERKDSEEARHGSDHQG